MDKNDAKAQILDALLSSKTVRWDVEKVLLHGDPPVRGYRLHVDGSIMLDGEHWRATR